MDTDEITGGMCACQRHYDQYGFEVVSALPITTTNTALFVQVVEYDSQESYQQPPKFKKKTRVA